ncbi:MAG: glycosyltransferase family 2 protein, partial [Saprospiraceae bacterium]
LGNSQTGSLTLVQKFGNWLSTRLIHVFYGYTFTDLGPFRAIKFSSLKKLEMQDQNFGWTVEMQVKAAKLKMKCKEVPVDYKKRLGESKVSGTIKGSILAGYKILYTIFKLL